MSFIIRIVQVLIFFVIFAGLFTLVVFTVNRVVQWVALAMGYEVGDFFEFLKSIMPKFRRRKRK